MDGTLDPAAPRPPDPWSVVGWTMTMLGDRGIPAELSAKTVDAARNAAEALLTALGVADFRRLGVHVGGVHVVGLKGGPGGLE